MIIITTWNSENSDPEVNSTCTVNECIDEHLTDDSVCTKSSLSSIPIEKDAEVIKHVKTTKSKEAFKTDYIHPKVTSFDLSVQGKHNKKMSVDIRTPTGQYWGTDYGTGSISCCVHHRNGSKYVPEGNWMLVVSGDEVSSIKAVEHY